MSFGGGGGWGGGGAGAKEEPTKWWGPAGSGAIITPGPAWPTEGIEKAKKMGILAVLVVLLLLSRTD